MNSSTKVYFAEFSAITEWSLCLRLRVQSLEGGLCRVKGLGSMAL